MFCGLLATMLVATACGHSTENRIPWWWWLIDSHSASEIAAAFVIEYAIEPICVSRPAADAVLRM